MLNGNQTSLCKKAAKEKEEGGSNKNKDSNMENQPQITGRES